MKKYVICLSAMLVAILASSFTAGDVKTNHVEKATASTRIWWNYYGEGLFDQCDPYYYGADEDNFPDCPVMVGLIYCEVYAYPSVWNPDIPDLSTITSTRMRLF
jgi:hypothetical protein